MPKRGGGRSACMPMCGSGVRICSGGIIIPGGITPGGIIPGGITPGGITPGAIIPGGIIRLAGRDGRGRGIRGAGGRAYGDCAGGPFTRAATTRRPEFAALEAGAGCNAEIGRTAPPGWGVRPHGDMHDLVCKKEGGGISWKEPQRACAFREECWSATCSELGKTSVSSDPSCRLPCRGCGTWAFRAVAMRECPAATRNSYCWRQHLLY